MASPADRGHGVLAATVVLFLSGAGACATFGVPPLPEGWTREDLILSAETVSRSSQRRRFATEEGSLELRGTVRRYSPQDVPGWDRPLVERAGSAAGGFLARQLGAETSDVVVGHGTLLVSGEGADDWQLRCAVFWLIHEYVEYDFDSGEDQVSGTSLRSRGMDCHGVRAAQPESTVWRVSYGIAPPLDSLAAVYDSLAAEASPAVAADPPVTLVHLTPEGNMDVSYTVQREEKWVRFGAADDQPLAVFHYASMPVTNAYGVDFAPDATGEEKVILRMIALALAQANGL